MTDKEIFDKWQIPHNVKEVDWANCSNSTPLAELLAAKESIKTEDITITTKSGRRFRKSQIVKIWFKRLDKNHSTNYVFVLEDGTAIEVDEQEYYDILIEQK